MDLKPKPVAKYKPKIKVKMCETCFFKGGDFFPDIENKEIVRLYCRARHTNVNVEQMNKFCDFYKKK